MSNRCNTRTSIGGTEEVENKRDQIIVMGDFNEDVIKKKNKEII